MQARTTRGVTAASSPVVGQSGGRLSTALGRILLTFLCALVPVAYAAIPAAQRTVLTNLYASANGASWTNNTNWNGAAGTECTWYGIVCDGGGNNVAEIQLGINNLSGTLPAISALTALQVFNVYQNNLTGSIPSLSGLTALRQVSVQYNQLSGPIPSLAGLTSLQVFYAYRNALSGPIPSLSGLASLVQFDADDNQLTGSIPSLGGLTALNVFSVGSNQLSGTVPPLAGLTGLATFNVEFNQLTGTLPSLGGLANLREFVAGGNQFTGTIPSLSGLGQLQELFVNDNQLTGSIPALTGLSQLSFVSVGHNQLTGALPSLAGLTALQYLYAPNNQLTGSIPDLSTTGLRIVSLNDNHLSGPVPQPPGSLLAGQSTLCGNGLASSGSAAVDAAWDTATGTSWLACQSASTTPICNVVVSQATISAGASTTLTAVCIPAANTYVWAGGSCGSVTVASCTTAPSVTTTYTVAGIGDFGRGANATAVITVTAQGFPLSTTTNVTAASATATATIQPAPADAGTSGSIFVFAHAPLDLIRTPDGPDLCVLAQIDPSSGRLVQVTPDTMRPSLSGALGSQAQSVPILSNMSTPLIAGSSFFIGYGASANAMLQKGTYQGVVSIPGTTACSAAIAVPAAPHAPDALSGLWWNANESGWGIHFTQRRNVLFAAWYTYDSASAAKWYVSTCNMPGTQATIAGTCSGPILEVTGTGFFGAAFNASMVNAITVGSLQVRFDNVDAASMTYTVRGVSRTVAITRQPLATGSTTPAVIYTDLWWNPNESGWGMAMAQQFGITFLAWYVYDTTGKPVWFVATCTMRGSSCTGTLYRTTGPAFGTTFDPSAVHATDAGTISVDFTDANNANISYTVDGVSAAKTITRQVF